MRMLVVLIAVSSSLALCRSARAESVTYSYTGNYFQVFSDSETATDPYRNPYMENDRVTGIFTLVNPLAPNLYEVNVEPISFSFNDGVQTIDQDNYTPAAGGFFQFSTDSAGNVTEYYFDIQRLPYPVPPHVGQYGDAPTAGVLEKAVTPEPSTFVLLGTGLLGVANVVRRRVCLS